MESPDEGLKKNSYDNKRLLSCSKNDEQKSGVLHRYRQNRQPPQQLIEPIRKSREIIPNIYF